MSALTPIEPPVTLSAEEEAETIVEILVAMGADEGDARVQADVLVEADLRGHPSHGIQRLPLIVERIRNGVIVPRAPSASTWVTSVVLHIEGADGFGPVNGMKAVESISARARETGVAIAVITRNNHLGMLAPYLERLTSRGQLGIAMTTSEALVHPFGGKKPMIGTNPLGVGIPLEPFPFIFDMSTGTVSMGKIIDHLHRGERLPAGWGLDHAGNPTTDPAHVGAIAPYGGAKGYGLGLAIELIVGALTGTALGQQITGTLDATTYCNKGDVFICIDPATTRLGRDLSPIAMYLDDIRKTPSQNGFDTVRVPGDRARKRRLQRLQTGIPVSAAVWNEILEFKHALESG